jgi:hypothetical protein
MFTAAYQDNRTGPIICTDENTAAGGANNWDDVLRLHFPGFLLPTAAEVELKSGKVGPALVAAFYAHAQTISSGASVTGPIEDNVSSTWEISSASSLALARNSK